MNMEAHIQEAMGLATSLLKTVQERPWRVVEDVSLDVAALVFALTGIITATCHDDDDDREKMLEDVIDLLRRRALDSGT